MWDVSCAAVLHVWRVAVRGLRSVVEADEI